MGPSQLNFSQRNQVLISFLPGAVQLSEMLTGSSVRGSTFLAGGRAAERDVYGQLGPRVDRHVEVRVERLFGFAHHGS
jgi:hypothetical protein